MPEVSYRLLIDGSPASPEIQAAIQQIEVEDHAEMADMLRLRLAIGVREGSYDWRIIDDSVFGRLVPIRIEVTLGSGRAEPLIEARIIETSADFSNQPGRSVLNVVAMDSTVLMNLEEKIINWPNMADSDIAAEIFQSYGFDPQVEETEPTRDELEMTTIQRGTDIQFLRDLAQRNGCECYVEMNPETGVLEGHFHPPRADQPAQGTLSVNMGEATNVNSFNARYDMLRPTMAQATGLDINTQEEQPAEVEGSSLPTLGRESALGGDQPRRLLLSQTGLSQTGELQTLAQAVADRSAWAITAEGELNTVAYGGILRAKRPVNVRGAGNQFSGTYYVEMVSHAFSGEGYTQRFRLRRNALGLTGDESFREDDALL